jgi:hypothetical protein
MLLGMMFPMTFGIMFSMIFGLIISNSSIFSLLTLSIFFFEFFIYFLWNFTTTNKIQSCNRKTIVPNNILNIKSIKEIDVNIVVAVVDVAVIIVVADVDVAVINAFNVDVVGVSSAKFFKNPISVFTKNIFYARIQQEMGT